MTTKRRQHRSNLRCQGDISIVAKQCQLVAPAFMPGSLRLVSPKVNLLIPWAEAQGYYPASPPRLTMTQFKARKRENIASSSLLTRWVRMTVDLSQVRMEKVPGSLSSSLDSFKRTKLEWETPPAILPPARMPYLCAGLKRSPMSFCRCLD